MFATIGRQALQKRCKPDILLLSCRSRIKQTLHDLLKFALVAVVCFSAWNCIPLPVAAAPMAQAGEPSEKIPLEEDILRVIQKHPDAILDSISAYQQQQIKQRQDRIQAVLQEMQAHPARAIGQSPATGSASQKIVLYVFSDFQCPYCGQVQQTLKQFMQQHQDEVSLVYKYLPLVSIHPEALSAAQAAWAASRQNKFWEFHDALFAQHDDLGEQVYSQIARSLGLNLKRFDRDRQSNEALLAIEDDLNMAKNLGVEGTPFFVMNGVPLQGNAQLSEFNRLLASLAQHPSGVAGRKTD